MNIVFDNIKAVLSPSNAEDAKILSHLNKKYNIFLESALYAPQYKLWKRTKGKVGWNGRVSLIQKDKLSTGLVPSCVEEIKRLKGSVTLIDKRSVKPLALGPFPGILRDYQKEAIKKSFSSTLGKLWFPRGVLEMATGSGKTLTAGAMTAMANVPTAFLVHREHLLDQTTEEFNKLGIEVGRVSAGISQPSRVTVASVQTLHSAKKSGEWDRLSWIQDVEQLFYDEAHTLASKLDSVNTFAGVCNLFENAYMRWALTGTAFKKDKFSNWILEGVAGPLLYSVTSSELISKNFLTPANIRMIKCKADWSTPNSWPTCYDIGVVLNKARNKKIVEEVGVLPVPCLILVDQIGHGNLLQKELKNTLGLEVPFVHGEASKAERLEKIKDCREGRLPRLIASTIFNEGLDLPNLRSLVLAGAKKSEVQNIQKLGRGLRKGLEKNVVQVVDFYDQNPKILEKHSRLRKQIWEEQGFSVVMEG